MQFLAKSLSKSIRFRQQSWVLSQQCYFTKPKMIPYQPKISNSVDLIGYVIQPVQFRHLPNGKLLADTVISQRSPSESESESDSTRQFRIPVIFEGDLAHTANCHLKKEDRIHVTGHVFVDASPSGDNPEKEYLQIVVNDFNYVAVAKASPQVLPIPDQKEADLGTRRNLGNGPWFDLLDKPYEWCDYRESKLNGSVNLRHPDFKKKDRSEALWLNKAPKEVLPGLQDAKFDSPSISKYGKQPKVGEEAWKDLVENINKYWDNRLNKRNLKAPDFVHKETGAALWLSSCPSWVIEEQKLPPPKSKAGEESWKDLVENMNNWWDKRLHKTNPKAPDFKHKETGVALWLNSAPSWVLEKLPPSKS